MVGNGKSGRSAQPGPGRRSTLEAVKAAALVMAKELYQSTGREIRGLGVALDDTAFETAALMFVDRTHEQTDGGHTQAERLAEILELGYFDGKIDDGGNEIPIRIAREELIRG